MMSVIVMNCLRSAFRGQMAAIARYDDRRGPLAPIAVFRDRSAASAATRLGPSS
jgi:hypothetical protein